MDRLTDYSLITKVEEIERLSKEGMIIEIGKVYGEEVKKILNYEKYNKELEKRGITILGYKERV